MSGLSALKLNGKEILYMTSGRVHYFMGGFPDIPGYPPCAERTFFTCMTYPGHLRRNGLGRPFHKHCALAVCLSVIDTHLTNCVSSFEFENNFIIPKEIDFAMVNI